MGFFETRHHSSTATSTRCQRCGTIGTTNLACPNPRCGEKLAPNVLQAFGDPLIDAGQDIGKATNNMARATAKGAGDIGAVFAGQASRDFKMVLPVVITTVSMAFEAGGASYGLSVILGTYIGLIGTPSLIALMLNSILLMAVLCVTFALMCGALLGMMAVFKLGGVLVNRSISRLYLLVPLLGLAVWMTLRIPTAFARWWEVSAFF